MGTHCEARRSPCASNPCLYGGTCIDNNSHFYCQCWGQYSGQRYEMIEKDIPRQSGVTFSLGAVLIHVCNKYFVFFSLTKKHKPGNDKPECHSHNKDVCQ